MGAATCRASTRLTDSYHVDDLTTPGRRELGRTPILRWEQQGPFRMNMPDEISGENAAKQLAKPTNGRLV
jgi:hypothetical protein